MSSQRIAGFTSNTVPWEILRAAGYTPVLLEDDAGSTPHADRWMEDVFDRRIRVIFDRLCSGAWNHLKTVVIPRTSEQEHKLYLYLRELARRQPSARTPQLHLYNLLHTRTPESYDYGLERTRQMVRDFGASDDDLREAIVESNRARACVRDILRKRRLGFLEGSAALQLIHGFYSEDRSAFAARIPALLRKMEEHVAGSRPRILIKGAPLNDASLHRVIETAGGYVIAEDDWRGSRAAGETDVCVTKDPVIAIFEKYFIDEVSPRVHASHDRNTWFQRQVASGDVDGVLFYIPLEDDVLGWDYPEQLAYVKAQPIPSILVRENSTSLNQFIRDAQRK